MEGTFGCFTHQQQYNRRQVVRGGREGFFLGGGPAKERFSQFSPQLSLPGTRSETGRPSPAVRSPAASGETIAIHLVFTSYSNLQSSLQITGGCTTCKHANKLINTKMCSLNVCMCAITNLTSSLSITTCTTSTLIKIFSAPGSLGKQHMSF
jgi:hypothetical protein